MKKKKKALSKYQKTVLILAGLIILLALTTISAKFCDWYTDHIYGPLCDAISHLTGQLPFVLGEILMYAGVFLVLGAILHLLLLPFFRRKERFRTAIKSYFQTLSVILLIVVLIYMPVWYIPICGTVLGQGNPEKRTTYSYDEVYELMKHFAAEANAAAKEISVDEDGRVFFYSPQLHAQLAVSALQNISDEFPRLQGYYPPIKPALCSDILDRMGIGGYNYPYTMEPTNNRYISPLYLPCLDAHEYCHHKGYYKENEAVFLSLLALSRSDDPYLRLEGNVELYYEMYDAYLIARQNILDQLIEAGKVDWPENINDHESAERANHIITSYFGKEPRLSQRARIIISAGADAQQVIYNADSHVIDSMPLVNKAIEQTADTGWKVQGDLLQENSYDGATLLILQYFYPD